MPSQTWEFHAPRDFPDLGDIFYREVVDYFEDQIGVMSREVRVQQAWLPWVTGRLTKSTYVDIDVDSSRFGSRGEDLLTVEFLTKTGANQAPYAPYVLSLPPAIDTYLQSVAYPRWKADVPNIKLKIGEVK